MKGFGFNIFLLFYLVFNTSCFLENAFGNNDDQIVGQNLKVDFSDENGSFESLTDYMNTSLRKVPPLSLADTLTASFGKAKLVKLWLNMDEMWDYRTDTYNFNFRINNNIYESDTVIHPYNRAKFEPSETHFEDFLRSFCPTGEQAILNVKRYQIEVINNVITMSQWKTILSAALTQYKSVCPNLNYLEVLNESRIPHFGGLTDDQYYEFYKASYEVVHAINSTLEPTSQIKIGGPASHGISLLDTNFEQQDYQLSNKGQQIYNFLKNYENDTDPKKRLDFISFHEYHIREKPIHLSEYEERIEKMFNLAGLDFNTEILLTEIAIAPPQRVKHNIEQAIGFLSLYKHNLKNSRIKLFPWVTYHTSEQQSLVMFDEDLKKTKFGQTSSLFNLHSSTIVYSESFAIDKDGIGVDILATKDDGKYVFQYWNYSEIDRDIDIDIAGIPEDLKNLSRNIYLITPQHDLTIFSDPQQLDSTLYNTTIHFEDINKISSKIPSYSTIMLEFFEPD